MALKLNIKPEIEEEIERLLPKASARSKTEYINLAIHEYNQKLKREAELSKLEKYFKTYRSQAKEIMNDFSKVRKPVD